MSTEHSFLRASDNASFVVKEYKTPYLGAPRNFSSGFELILILGSRGESFIGDNISTFREGDLFFIGPNLPHYWHNDNYYHEKGVPAHYILVQFHEHFLGEEFFKKPEMTNIRHMMDLARQGLKFKGKIRKEGVQEIKNLVKAEGFDKILRLLNILNNLANSSEHDIISNPGFTKRAPKNDSGRIDKVYQYILDNYQEKLTLEEAASIIGMSKSAFCQFFKKSTGKSFSRVVNEIRTGHACRLLINQDMTVNEICYACGFSNLSYFNRRFKEVNGLTPATYRKYYLEMVQKQLI